MQNLGDTLPGVLFPATSAPPVTAGSPSLAHRNDRV